MEILTSLPQFGNLFLTLLAFVVALSVIVAVHEYGHYIVGRWSGIKAEVFSLGFGPVLFSRMDRHGTRWQIAALPFGGFVKFLGDSDAASGKDGAAMAALPPERLRQTMHGAPLWARTATVAAGPVFNFILSIVIFSAVMMTGGKTADPLTVGALKPLPVAGVTLEPGDRVLSIEGQPLPDVASGEVYDNMIDALPREALLRYTVERAGREIEAMGPQLMPPLISGLAPQSAAFAADLEAGDVITAVNGTPIVAFEELKDVVEGSNGAPIALTVWRPEGESHEVTITPRRVDEPQPEGGFRTEWRIGIAGGMAFEPATERLGLIEAVGDAVGQIGDIIQSSLSGLYHMITGAISSCNMSGPIGIAQVSGAMASQGAQSFIWFIAVLSTAVGLLNLFPVPVLDGGHLVFYAYEAVAGRPPSERALRVLMTVGLTLILSLMLFALFNDIFCP
ncbi:MAG: RIP metalloprotease RseP [Roseovarius sp.]|uniref:RIP metalloprotease RseP n=1 Tax=Roseovarius sp. TaxID=1486281 RepID=UPI001B41E77E|nr:RIP metalloprotease RseP [Roseovarius sp.]MBQ0748982.1 RIP metalloprotease RseP [Roseovarius sp.]MBQ0809845.1 RIP metalloprotease RseP [Roseovarius sp.]